MGSNLTSHLVMPVGPVVAAFRAPVVRVMSDAALASTASAGATAADIVGFDLCLFDAQGATLGGAQNELISSARLDNLGSCLPIVQALTDAGIAYEHHRELAPTTELRQLQYAEDDRLGVGKRSRVRISDAYRAGYEREILAAVDLDELVASLSRWERPALLCVEAEPEACHRSVVAERLESERGARVTHLRPPVTRS